VSALDRSGDASATNAAGLRADPRGPGLLVGEGVELGAGVSIGAHVVIHAGTIVGDGCVLEDGTILGKRPRLAKSSGAHGEVGPLRLAEQVTVCAGAIVFAGAAVGEGTILGDQSFVRERSRIGDGSVVGRGSVVDNDVTVGARVRVQTNVYLTAYTAVEDDVFLGPGVLTTNDNAMTRHPPNAPLIGALLRRACRIGGGAVLTPGVEIGEEAFVAAGAVVTSNVPPRAVVMGAPARVVREVPDEDLLENWR
jgi:acetyltransferase-like isoleucine patch superfamily enzyme